MVLVSLMASAQDLRKDGLNGIYYSCYEGSFYEGVENEAYVRKADKDLTGTVVIPETVTQNGIVYTVTVIDENAFEDCQLSEIVIPNGVRNISEEAFDGCTNLTAVYIGKNIESIGEDAFSGCDNLRDFTILAGLPPTVSRYDPIDPELRAQITLHAPTEVLGFYLSDNPFWGTFKAYDDVINIPTAIAATKQHPIVGPKSHDLQGRQLRRPQKGLNIIWQEDGSVKKVIIKPKSSVDTESSFWLTRSRQTG